MIFCAIILVQSCTKPHETRYVNLDETVQTGSTYSLDLASYGNRNAIVSIVSQPTHYTVSQVDCDAATSGRIYHFSTDTKLAEKEKVVIDLSAKDNGMCSHDDDKTVITINFTVR